MPLSFAIKPLHERAPAKGKSDVEKTIASVEALAAKPREQRYVDEDKRKDAWRDACDSEYWLCLCFASHEEKDAFMSAAGLAGLPDKHVDGLDVAERMGIVMPPRKAPPRALRRIGTRMLRFVR